MRNSTKKMLVTGGAGFIGSHLVRGLLEKGYRVIVIDNLNTGKIKNLPKDKNLRFIQASILDSTSKYFSGVDTVFHLAALTRPQFSIKHPVESNKVNVEGTLRVLMNANKHKVRRFVFMSSSSIYGDSSEIPTTEKAKPKPVSPYGAQKIIGEEYCFLFSNMYGLEVNCIRPFNVYGPGQSTSGYANAIPKFISLLNKKKPPTIYGNGKQSRDFIYVEDVVNLLILAAESTVCGESFNAGTGENISISSLYKTISTVLKSQMKPIHGQKVIEPYFTLADISKAKKLLKWKPKVTLKEGLERTIRP